MPGPAKRLVLLLLIILSAGLPAWAQQYHFRTYNELDGLLSSKVFDLAQDADGSIWFATARGLSRYDSSNWENAGVAPDTLRLTYNFVGLDQQQRIWTIGHNIWRRVFMRDQGQWHEIPVPTAISRHGHGAYALGQTPGGEVFLAMAGRRGEVDIYAGGQWIVRQLAGDKMAVQAMVFAEGKLLFATNQGLLSIDPADWEIRPTAVTSPVHAICPVFAGTGVFVIGDDWIGRGTLDHLEIIAKGLALEFDVPSGGAAAQADRTGGVYFGDQGQVYFYHPHYGLELLSRANGLQSSGVTRFLLDREGSVWVAGLRGVSKLVNRGMAGYDSRHGLYDDEVSAILQRSNGEIVLGHLGGLTLMGLPPRRIGFAGRNPILDRVGDLAESPDHEVWFAANRLGVGHLKNDDTVEFVADDSGLLKSAYALQFDGEGGLWVGTNVGVVYWNGSTVTPVDFSAIAGNRSVLTRRLALARDGSLLIASGRFGLLHLRDGRPVSYPTIGGDGALGTYTVMESESGDILVGTVGGLFVVAGDTLRPAAAPWPVIERPVYGIVADRRGRYWFGTDNGVMRWDGQDLVYLTNQDGLLGTETNRDALKVDRYGDLWIGTNRGLTIYREDFDQTALAPPLISLVGFEVDGTHYDINQPLRLSSPPQSLTASFHGVTFRDESRTTYLTWLEGFESTWQGPEPAPRGLVRYSRVPAGKYVFHVRVRAADGMLSPEAISAEIVVMPPVTARWWFRLLLVGGALVLMGGVASNLSGRRYARRLETRVHERTADLKRSEDQLRAETQRLGATLESISDGVVVLDDQSRIVMCNAAVERLLGRSEQQLLGRRLAEVLALDLPGPVAAGEPTTHLLTVASGRQAWFEISSAPLVGPDNVKAGTVLALRDITTRREVEDQRIRTQQLESLGVLAGGIAHDFNNLLTVILGNVSLVEESPGIGSEEHGQLDRIKAATENARALTEQFLTFAKGGDPELKSISLARNVRQVANLIFGGGTVAYELDVAPDLWPVAADSGQLAQVLNNLFLNARQAVSGTQTVVIKAQNIENPAPTAGADRWVSLEVHDQGVGISAENLGQIFDPYFSTKEQGVGLGLAIVHSIVRRHGGRLSVVSELGQGTVFTLVLPASTSAVREDTEPDLACELQPGRILVLDDEAELLTLYERMLTGLNMTCETTADGAQTVAVYEAALASENGFAAVIMDLTIPGGMGGREAVQKLLALKPEARVIVASGYSNDPVLAHFRNYGFCGVLKKPFDKKALRRALLAVGLGDTT